MNRFLRALEARYIAGIEESLSIIDLYLTKAVGVGEHPDILSIIDQELSKLENNKSKLTMLRELVSNTSEEVTPKQSDK